MPTSRRAALPVLPLLLTVGCLAGATFHPEAVPAPAFEPEVFFAGRTHGEGALVQRFHGKRTVSVEGEGHTRTDGAFVLDQQVTVSDGSRERREWILRPTGPGHYTGQLSDASGEVAASAQGNVFHLRYLVRQPAVYMEQDLYLQPDRRTVLNVATVSVLGIPWARLSERITRAE